jgi:hypothetical protein
MLLFPLHNADDVRDFRTPPAWVMFGRVDFIITHPCTGLPAHVHIEARFRTPFHVHGVLHGDGESQENLVEIVDGKGRERYGTSLWVSSRCGLLEQRHPAGWVFPSAHGVIIPSCVIHGPRQPGNLRITRHACALRYLHAKRAAPSVPRNEFEMVRQTSLEICRAFPEGRLNAKSFSSQSGREQRRTASPIRSTPLSAT